jgi:hypothetical protein
MTSYWRWCFAEKESESVEFTFSVYITIFKENRSCGAISIYFSTFDSDRRDHGEISG